MSRVPERPNPRLTMIERQAAAGLLAVALACCSACRQDSPADDGAAPADDGAVPADDAVMPADDGVMTREEMYYSEAASQAAADGPPLVKVVASDTGEPVPGALVGLTLIGPDGGDGGFNYFLTRDDGIALRHRPLEAGRYQPHIEPNPESRFSLTHWRRGEPYVVVAQDGSTSVPTLRLNAQGAGTDE